MSRIFSQRLLSIFIIGICVIFAMKTAAQMPSLAEQVFQKHQTILLSEDVQAVLPEVLVELKKPEHQELLTPTFIEAILENPDLLKIIVPEINDEFITLLKQEDSDLRILVSDPDVQTLLQMPAAIDELLYLLELAKRSLATRIFERYKTLFQRADVRESLPEVLTTLKQPDTQALLQPAMIKLIAENPELLKVIDPEIDGRVIVLFKEDSEVNILINDPDFHVLLQDPDAIDELAVLLNIGTMAIVWIVPVSIESPEVGSALTFGVVISNAHNVRGYHLSVQFDPEALRYVSSQQGTYFSGDVFAAPATVESDQVSFIVTAPAQSADTQGVLLTVMFEVVAAKASVLSLNDVVLVSDEGMALPVKTEDSAIVEPMFVEPEDEEVIDPGSTEIEESESVESTPEETEDRETDETIPMEPEESSEGTEPMPVEPEESSEGAEPMPVEPEEDSEGTEPIPVEPEEGSEGTEPMPMEPEESSEGTEPMPVEPKEGSEGTEPEDDETAERLTPTWDVNEDRFVNILDLVLVLSSIGQEGPTPADVNGDNVVNILDLTLVVNHLGEYYEQP